MGQMAHKEKFKIKSWFPSKGKSIINEIINYNKKGDNGVIDSGVIISIDEYLKPFDTKHPIDTL